MKTPSNQLAFLQGTFLLLLAFVIGVLRISMAICSCSRRVNVLESFFAPSLAASTHALAPAVNLASQEAGSKRRAHSAPWVHGRAAALTVLATGVAVELFPGRR